MSSSGARAQRVSARRSAAAGAASGDADAVSAGSARHPASANSDASASASTAASAPAATVADAATAEAAEAQAEGSGADDDDGATQQRQRYQYKERDPSRLPRGRPRKTDPKLTPEERAERKRLYYVKVREERKAAAAAAREARTQRARAAAVPGSAVAARSASATGVARAANVSALGGVSTRWNGGTSVIRIAVDAAVSCTSGFAGSAVVRDWGVAEKADDVAGALASMVFVTGSAREPYHVFGKVQGGVDTELVVSRASLLQSASALQTSVTALARGRLGREGDVLSLAPSTRAPGRVAGLIAATTQGSALLVAQCNEASSSGLPGTVATVARAQLPRTALACEWMPAGGSGAMIVTGGCGGDVRLWSCGAGRVDECYSVVGHDAPVSKIVRMGGAPGAPVHSAHQHLLASVGFDGNLVLWDTRAPLAVVQAQRVNLGWIMDAAVTRRGALAMVMGDGQVRVLDLQSGRFRVFARAPVLPIGRVTSCSHDDMESAPSFFASSDESGRIELQTWREPLYGTKYLDEQVVLLRDVSPAPIRSMCSAQSGNRVCVVASSATGELHVSWTRVDVDASSVRRPGRPIKQAKKASTPAKSAAKRVRRSAASSGDEEKWEEDEEDEDEEEEDGDDDHVGETEEDDDDDDDDDDDEDGESSDDGE